MPEIAPSPITGVTQIALASADPAGLVAFYRDVAGFPFLFEANGMSFLQAGAVRLMIHALQPSQKAGSNFILYFEPSDWGAAEARLETAGIAFKHEAQVVQRAEGKEMALRAFEDPEGHLLALLGWRPI
jgi:methylmalonyl-CoA/ethylmalonyl-CoA epimerase